MLNAFLRGCSHCILAILLASSARADNIDWEHLQASCPGAKAWMEHEASITEVKPPSATATDQRLRGELLRMETEDQDVRRPLSGTPDADGLQRESDVDRKHLGALRRILDTSGVPTSNRVGSDGVHAFWLLVQHAQDIELQKHVLRALEAYESGIKPSELALLADRIRTNENHPQMYGSQFHIEAGRLVPDPIEDEKHVDARRAKMGLMPLSDYACMLNVLAGFPSR
jgi:hypothetical protein